jgi:hypothetical protein
MTITEARERLETGMHVWLDFDWWSSLQLYARGLDGKEYIQKSELVFLLHKKREAELEAFQANLEYEIEKMNQAGASLEEINNFRSSHWEELQKLVKAWRSLD